MRSQTVTTVLDADQQAVFDYRSDIARLPEWATEFARELRRDGDDYKVVNGLGEFYFATEADRDTGVIDMFAGPRSGITGWRLSPLRRMQRRPVEPVNRVVSRRTASD